MPEPSLLAGGLGAGGLGAGGARIASGGADRVEQHGYTGASLTAYRARRALTVGLLAQHLGIEREAVIAAEGTPGQPLVGALLLAFRDVMQHQEVIDELLPPEAPPVEREPGSSPKSPPQPPSARKAPAARHRG